MKFSEQEEFKSDLTFWIWLRFEVVIAKKQKIKKFQDPPFRRRMSTVIKCVHQITNCLKLSHKRRKYFANLILQWYFFDYSLNITDRVNVLMTHQYDNYKPYSNLYQILLQDINFRCYCCSPSTSINMITLKKIISTTCNILSSKIRSF